jgi:hypothetical protein
VRFSASLSKPRYRETGWKYGVNIQPATQQGQFSGLPKHDFTSKWCSLLPSLKFQQIELAKLIFINGVFCVALYE